MSNYKIPFSKDGNQLSYDGFGCVEMRDNFEFEDTLEYVTYSKGRSAIGFEFKRTDGTEVTMFATDFHDVLPFMVSGKVSGKFTFSKRGQNYGCKMIEPGKDTLIVITGPAIPDHYDAEFVGDVVKGVSDDLHGGEKEGVIKIGTVDNVFYRFSWTARVG